jgi:hypothetical protein
MDAAEMIGVGLTQMYNLIGQGLVDSVLIGRRRYVTRQSLERLATPPGPQPAE